MCRPEITAVTMAVEAHSPYMPHACLANCASLFGPRICTCPATHPQSSSAAPVFTFDSKDEKPRLAIEPPEESNDECKPDLSREDSAVDTGDQYDIQQSAEGQHIAKLVALLEQAKAELISQQQLQQRELIRLQQEAEQYMNQARAEHEAQLADLNAKHVQQLADKDQEAADMREEVARLRIQVEDYIVFKDNVEQEQRQREALEQAQLNKQVCNRMGNALLRGCAVLCTVREYLADVSVLIND